MSLNPQHVRLLARAEAARRVLKDDPGADGALLLSYVVWPGERECERARRWLEGLYRDSETRRDAA